MTALTLQQALIASAAAALVIFSTRAFPFLLFSRREPPKILVFVEHSIPPMVMAILVVNCFSSAGCNRATLSQIVSLATVGALHLWRRNPMISIFGGTILYMVLIRL